jgi:hypothetical protein
MSIQRWDYDDLCAGPLKFKGEVFVTYDDHAAALAEYRQQHDGISERYFRQIRNDALKDTHVRRPDEVT